MAQRSTVTGVAAGTKRVEVLGEVSRKAGGTEDLGTIAYWHRNPLKRLAWRWFGWTP